MDDKNCIKDRILKDVGKSIKLIQQVSVGIENCENYGSAGGSGGAVNSNSWLVQSLCCHLDLAFRHGLREPSLGFWPLLQGLSHSDTFQVIDGLQNICSPLGKGLIWLHHTLMEGSLQSYLLCLSNDNTTLRRYYTSRSILRDPSCSQQLLTLLAGLENISFIMNTDGTDLQEATGFSGLTSMTSSLSSPVDSGVALLDSDADVTSTNEATVTEGDSASLREEVAMLPELEDNRINDHIVSQEIVKNKDTVEISGYTRSNEKQVASGAMDPLNKGNLCEELDGILKSRFVEEPLGDCHSVINSHSEKFILPKECASEFDCSKEELNKILVDTQVLSNSNSSVSLNKISNTSSNSCNLTQLSKSTCLNQPSTNRMTESCVALIEGRNDGVNLESCKSDDSLNDNKWAQDADVMSKSVGADTTVIRRQRKKKRNGPDVKVKRVSFHEDLLMQTTESTSGFSASFLPPNPVIKCDVVKGRYSWCAEGDAPFFEQRKNENDTKSDVYLSTSGGILKIDSDERNMGCTEKNPLSENKLCTQVCEASNQDSTKPASSRGSIIDTKLPPVTERGMPEGQEDPPKTSSLLHLNSITDSVLKKFPSIASSIDWSSDTESDVCDHRMSGKGGLASRKEDRRVSSKCQNALLKFSTFMSPSKTSLLKKFMKSVTEKKSYQKKAKLRKSKPLFISGAKPDPVVAGQTLAELDSIYSNVNSFTKSGCIVGAVFEKTLKNQIFRDSKETLYKVFKANSSYFIDGKSQPLLIVLSEFGIYFVGLQPNMSIFLQVMMCYDELESIIVGPSRQTLLFANLNRTKQMLVTSSNRLVTGEIISHIEVAMRRSPMKFALPAVGQLELDNMKTLKLQLSRDHVLLNDEQLHHYSIANIQDNPTSPPSTPLGPKKEGHLMFRPATNTPLQPWEPGYFILKGGVVYMFSDQGSRLPKRVIPLHGGQCHGCRRIPQESRPHTFEILLDHKRSFQFAAADEYETSEWLQALVQSASGNFFHMSIQLPLDISSFHFITFDYSDKHNVCVDSFILKESMKWV
ncbi:Uncharacterized protein GBIM_07930, partial [Gryllus bimaculatus]